MNDARAPEAQGSLRIDKWLWHARFFKTRSLAAKTVSDGRFRVNGTPISKPARMVTPGDTLTFPLGPHIRLIRIEALGLRRGPAPEARALYTDLDPPQPRSRDLSAPQRVGGRPTKKARRDMDATRARDLE